MKVESIVRRVADLGNPDSLRGLSDPYGIAIRSSDVISAYKSNPSLANDECPAELLGVADGKIFAGVGFMPIRILADGSEYETSANPNTQVAAEYRKTGFALDILQFAIDCPRDRIRLDFYVSPSARKAIKLYGGVVFDIRQFAMVKKSSLFLKGRLNFPAWIRNMVCIGLDALMFFHRAFVGLITMVRTIGWRMSMADDDENLNRFAELISEDTHRFKVMEDVAFLKWLLANDFCGKNVAQKHLWKVEKRGDLIGYVMMRQDGEGRGRIIDWQIVKGKESLLARMLLFASKKLIKTTKAVVVSVSATDLDLVKSFRHLLLPLPMQAATLGADDGSPLRKHVGWEDANNWRIRPTMGDSGLY